MTLGPITHLQTAPEWQTASTRKYSLWGFVRTDVPGYRNIQIGSSLLQVASGTYRWDAFITQIDSQLAALGGWGCSFGTGGQVQIALGSPGVVTFPDRLGWLLGFGVEAGQSVPSAATPTSIFVPPGGTPLLGATWTEVTLERERRQSVDLSLRNSGYVWGSARLWRVEMTMTRGAYEAFMAGWLRAGRIAVVPVGNEAVPLTPDTRPDGYLDGYYVRTERMRWVDTQQRYAEVTAIITTTVS